MKGMNIKKYLFIIAICAVIALIVYSSGGNKSTTNAAYRTEVNGSDSARVAKWDINSLDKDGEEMSLSADVQNIETGSGNWFLEIENLSNLELNNKPSISFSLISSFLLNLLNIPKFSPPFYLYNLNSPILLVLINLTKCKYSSCN